jgi:GTP-binding protein
MNKLRVEKAEFVTTAVSSKGYPKLHDSSGVQLPEVAFVGRSNVGKSSLINHLLRRKNLARTSSTPGKTQAINFFSIDERVVFVDLPGYGFAQVPKKMKKEWALLIQEYLETRDQLQLILFLFDIRRKPNEDDYLLMDWLLHYQKPFVLVLTKADKLTKTERAKQKKAIIEAFEVENMPVILYSATKNIGRPELLSVITEENKNDPS